MCVWSLEVKSLIVKQDKNHWQGRVLEVKKLITNLTRIIVKCVIWRHITDSKTRQESSSSVCLGSIYWLQSKTVIICKCAFGCQNIDYKTRQESYSSVFIEDKSLIAKPDKNHRQVCFWGQITDYQTKLKLLTNQ